LDKILVTTSSFGKEDSSPIDMLCEAGYEVVLNPLGRKLTENEVLNLLSEVKPVAMVAGVEPLTARVLGSAPFLKVISRCGIGMDSVDLDTAEKRGITIMNTPDGPTRAVAELTVGMMLNAMRKITEVDSAIRSGQWRRPMGRLLGEQTVGLMGCGRIGSAVAELLKPFGPRMIGYDPFVKDHPLVSIVSLTEMLKESDVVSLHIPYDQSIYHLFNEKKINKMKTGALLINTSRGGIVDEEALYDAIVSGHLAGACLDTFEKEPYTGPLTELGQVVLTPHIGSYAKEARIKMEKDAVYNLLSVIKNS